jgi:hypothetical protein
MTEKSKTGVFSGTAAQLTGKLLPGFADEGQTQGWTLIG